jgi:Flp pilus assembly protein TadB
MSKLARALQAYLGHRNTQHVVRYTSWRRISSRTFGVDQRTGFNVEVTIFILGSLIILLFAAVVRVLGTNLGYKVLIVVIVLYFLLVKR